MKILITTYPFGISNKLPSQLLKKYSVIYNDCKRKYTRDELVERLKRYNPDIIIAGTENYDSTILKLCNNLKIISRVGIGLDSIDLDECKKRGIIVTYTPDAPSNAVSEMVIGQIISLLRKLSASNRDIKDEGIWRRYIGREIKDSTIGIIGCGRIGKLVAKKIKSFEPRNIFVNDLVRSKVDKIKYGKYVSKKQLLSSSDIITIHIPLNKKNYNLITKKEFDLMKKNALIVNTSRGGIINENDLYSWLKKNKNAGAIIDVFEQEPYTGCLTKLDNTLLTPHIGSCSEKSRFDMEVGAAKEVLNYLHKKPFNNRVI